MKTIAKLLLTSLTITLGIGGAFAQGTAFTYQGRLASNGTNANGLYDLKFTLYDALSGGSIVAGPKTNSPVTVSNGIFTVTLDFGAGVFTGPQRFLEIGTRSNTVAVAFTVLTPRQELTPTPYAITSENLDGLLAASQLTGTIPGGLLSGTYGNALNLNNAGNTFTGNGAGLIGLNASALASGTVADARLSGNVAFLNKNQTFISNNVFASGTGVGRLSVSNTFVVVDTNLFTGMSFQYDASFGEGALMSSYNDGTAYLSFYTKAFGGQPITKQMSIGALGDVSIDLNNQNNGLFNHSSMGGVGLSFGSGSGEGIASKRTAGGNQFGLDFYVGFSNRVSFMNNGFIGLGRQYQISGSEAFGILAPVSNTWGGMYIQNLTGGRPFYGYTIPSGTAWTELDGTDTNKWKLYNSGYWLAVTTAGEVGIGTMTPQDAKLDVEGYTHVNDYDIFLRGGSDRNHGIAYRSTVNGGSFGIDGPFVYGFNGGALGLSGPEYAALIWGYTGNVWISNNCSVATLTIRGGADLAEPFEISDSGLDVTEGSVMIIDEENPGHLKMSNRPYDTRVAGIISGANGVNPGIQMQQQGLLEGGKNVALTGRVYVHADATFGAIKPGDMLTTSATPGYAMKVSSHSKAQGAILGKAMTGLKEGRGSVLVLVSLQ